MFSPGPYVDLRGRLSVLRGSFVWSIRRTSKTMVMPEMTWLTSFKMLCYSRTTELFTYLSLIFWFVFGFLVFMAERFDEIFVLFIVCLCVTFLALFADVWLSKSRTMAFCCVGIFCVFCVSCFVCVCERV